MPERTAHDGQQLGSNMPSHCCGILNRSLGDDATGGKRRRAASHTACHVRL